MSIFSIGLSGLNSAQVALHTTSNNISNVYTPGYNRELTLFEENGARGGARVSDVQRQFDQFIATQLNSARSASSALQSYQTQVSQIDNLLADTEAGLAPIMQDFFASLQDLAANPSDPASRQGVIGNADTLSAQFRSLDGYLDDMQSGIANQIKSEVIQINNTVQQIANLNKEIILARARSGEAPNAMLNQRDHLISELGERVDISVSMQEGSYNVSVGNGQPLVAGTQAYSLGTMYSKDDPTRTVVSYLDAAGGERELAEDTFSDGALGGLMNFRSETLDGVQNKIGHLAASLAMAFNELHTDPDSTDLDGNVGTKMFNVAEPRVYSRTGNDGTAVMSAELTNHREMTGEDYRLEVTAGNEFRITRLDGSLVAESVALTGGELAFGGMTITIDDPALLVEGDSFQILPTRHAAGEMENRIHDTSLIAAGQGGASGDNRNALAMQSLQDTAIVGGTATLSQSYAGLVGDVGNRTNIVQINLASQESLKEQIYMVQQSESGVNLDEEAANLIRYQQYYQANAQVINIASTLMDTILAIR